MSSENVSPREVRSRGFKPGEVRSRGLNPSRGRRVLRWVLRGLGALLLLLVLVLGWLHSGPGQRWARGLLEKRLAARVDGTLRIGSLDFTLFGKVALGDVVVTDAAGTQVVALRSLRIWPQWRALLGGEIALGRLELDGLTLYVKQEADGTSNLSRLIKPTPPSQKPSQGPPKERRVRLGALAISDVDVTLDKPDGTRIAIADLGIDASVDAVPSVRTVELDASRIALGVRIDSADRQRVISVGDLNSGLHVSLVRGAGKARLSRTTALVRVESQGAPPRELPIELGQLEVGIGEGQLDVTLDQLLAGALLLGSVEVHGRTQEGALAGDQKVDVAKVHVDAGRLNQLLGKELLATDVDVKTTVAGPPERLVLASAVDTQGGQLRLAGTVDVSDLARPGYDLELTGSEISTKRLLRDGATTAPPVEAQTLKLAVKGRGVSRDQAEADVVLELGKTTVGKVVIDSVNLEGRYERGVFEIKKLEVKSLGQRANLHGRAELEGKKVKAQLTLAGDPAVALARLRAAGVPAKTQLPPGLLAIRDGGLKVDVDGELDGTLRTDVELRPHGIAGGTLSARAHVDLVRRPDDGGRKFEARKLNAVVVLDDVDLGELAAMRGKKLPPGVGGNVNGRIHVSGSAEDPVVDYQLSARAKASPLGGLLRSPTLAVDVKGKADKRNLEAEVTAVRDDGSSKLPLLTAVVEAPLETGGGARRLSPNRPMRVKVDMPRRKAEDYLAFIPKTLWPILFGKNIPSGEGEVHVDLGGTPAAPDGTFDIDVSAALHGGMTQRVKITGRLSPDEGKAAKVNANVKGWVDVREDPTLTARADAKLSESPLVPGQRAVDWQLALDMRPTELWKIPRLPENIAKLHGTAGAQAKLHGNREDVLGDVELRLADVWTGQPVPPSAGGAGAIKPPNDPAKLDRPVGPIGANVKVQIVERETQLAASVTAGRVEALRAKGTIGLAGDGLIPTIREKRAGAAPLAIAVEVPRRPLAELEALRPSLVNVPGEIDGDLRVAGTIATPTAEGLFVWDRFKTVGGTDGRNTLGLHADANKLDAKLGLGAPSSGPALVSVDVSAPRGALGPYREGKGVLPVVLVARAADVDLRRLVPAYTLQGKVLDVGGRLDWNMNGEIGLEKTPQGGRIAHGRLDGKLDLGRGGYVSLLGSKRRYDQIELRIVSGPDALRLEKLSLRESDLAEQKRSVSAQGELGWNNLSPERAQLDLRTHKWLVFGSDKLGPTDAPRAEVSADIGVTAKLEPTSRRVDATVRSLEFSVPERFARAHQPEVTSLGDVVYLDEAGGKAGKLPVPKSVIERARATGLAARTPEPSQEDAAKTAEPAGTPTDIHVLVPKPIHFAQAPLDLWLQGNIDARLAGGSRQVNGKLDAVKGDITVIGKKHQLDRGSIVFDETDPGGRFDLHFSRKLHVATLRDVSEASGGDSVKVDMTGPISKPKVQLSGAGNALLYDVAAVLNAGRTKQYTEPDLPASSTVQLPQHGELLALTYMSINLPHNLFLNKFNAWADADDGPKAYGRVQHMEAERYSEDGKTRVRVVSRPPSPGQSEGELWLDWLLANDRNKVFGVGVNGGSRVGGGPGVFFEWSSKD